MYEFAPATDFLGLFGDWELFDAVLPVLSLELSLFNSILPPKFIYFRR
jgi:hypothetical protein